MYMQFSSKQEYPCLPQTKVCGDPVRTDRLYFCVNQSVFDYVYTGFMADDHAVQTQCYTVDLMVI